MPERAEAADCDDLTSADDGDTPPISHLPRLQVGLLDSCVDGYSRAGQRCSLLLDQAPLQYPAHLLEWQLIRNHYEVPRVEDLILGKSAVDMDACVLRVGAVSGVSYKRST